MKREVIYRTDAMAAIGNLKGLSDTDKSKAMKAVLSVPGMPQPEEDCDTCKHGYFGDRQCDNCRVRYPSHYEREEEQHDRT